MFVRAKGYSFQVIATRALKGTPALVLPDARKVLVRDTGRPHYNRALARAAVEALPGDDRPRS